VYLIQCWILNDTFLIIMQFYVKLFTLESELHSKRKLYVGYYLQESNSGTIIVLGKSQPFL